MKKNNTFLGWLDGERGFVLKTDLKEHRKKPILKRVLKYDRPGRLEKGFALGIIAAGTLIAVILCMSIVTLPPFGDAANPTNNEIVERYVGSAHEETGAENVIAGMILNYRGFDTFGESCVLFLALSCVIQLLWEPDKKKKSVEKKDLILYSCGKLMVPFLLVFGVCILFNGHTSPGGGFSGGTVLGASLILLATACGMDSVSRFFTQKIFNFIRIFGLMLYAVMFGIYIYQGANGIESSLAQYLVQIIDLAVGLVVMSTIYGFYSYYMKGDL